MKIVRLFQADRMRFVFALLISYEACIFTVIGSDRSSIESSVISTQKPAHTATTQPPSYQSDITWYTGAESGQTPELPASSGSYYGVGDDSSLQDVLSGFNKSATFSFDVPPEAAIKYASGHGWNEPKHHLEPETAQKNTDFSLNFLTSNFSEDIRIPIGWFVCVAVGAGSLYFLFKVVVILSPFPTWIHLRFRPFVQEAPTRASKADPRLARARVVLGVSPEATAEEIKRAYRQLMKMYHPDTYVGSQDLAHEKANELNEAYNFLKNQKDPA